MLSKDTNIDEIKKKKELQQFAPYFSGRLDGQKKDEEGKTFAELNAMFPTWNPDSMIEGVKRLEKIGTMDGEHIYSVYSEDEIKKENTLQNVKVIHFPGECDKPYVIVCAGGAYMSVCSLTEAFPVAARFNELGYTAFVLNYRTSSGKGAVIPKPLEDVAAAVKYINKNLSKFNLTSNRYAIAGFSAGGNLVNTWGLQSCGYGKYQVEKPEVIFSCYTVSSLKSLLNTDGEMFLNIMFGENYEKKLIDQYDVLSNITKDYPPCYINACEDDDTVSVEQSVKLHEKLTECGVLNKIWIGQHGGHGYGDGRGTDVEGWIDEAVKFWNQLKVSK